jgi:hypothetical protein
MYYVYELIDPRVDLPFYVGKGKDKRVYFHLSEQSRAKSENKKKFNKIQKIKKEGYEPEIKIVEYFENENDAYDYEEKLIKKYGRKGYDKDGILTKFFKDWYPHLYNQVIKVTPYIIEKIKIPILKKIDKYVEYYDNHSLIEKDFKDITSFLRYYQLLTAFLADIYTILRIMKYDSVDEYNNCILYVGDAHIEGIEEMLSTLDFKLIDSKKSDTYDPLMRFNSPPIEGEIQCVKNIIQFDKFFLS